MDEFEGVEHLDERCEKGEAMENPIPSAMVYFDEKEKRAVLCLDKGHPPTMVEPCYKNGAFHTHSWVPLGWMSEQAFITSLHRHGLAAEFVHSTLFAVISIRDRYAAMERERAEVLTINTKLRGIIRNLTTEMNGAIPYVECEVVKGKLFTAISKAQTHRLAE